MAARPCRRGRAAIAASGLPFLLMAVAPCAPWFEAEQFSLCEPGDVRPDIFEAAVRAAEAVLFVKTQRIYTGACTDTWRPSEGCRCRSWSGCSCPNYPHLTLRSQPVISVTEVRVDGDVLPEEAWVLGDPANPRTAGVLYRVDGGRWPCCQDIALDVDQPGTWQVVYDWGTPPPPGAAGMGQALTCEFLKAWGVGGAGKCRLPRTVTNVTRENVTQSLLSDRGEALLAGLTGLTEVDTWLAAVNPSGADRPPQVLNPDLMGLGHDPTNTTPGIQRADNDGVIGVPPGVRW
jgi:hypothetical protein